MAFYSLGYLRVSAKWLMCYYFVFVNHFGHIERDKTVKFCVTRVTVLLLCLYEAYWPHKTRYNCSFVLSELMCDYYEGEERGV